MSESSILLRPDWPVPAHVHAVTTLRRGAGVSAAPFDEFNLGERCGDDADAVARNRAQLRAIAQLPGEPRWLQQVHGAEVVRYEGVVGCVLDAPTGSSHQLVRQDAPYGTPRAVSSSGTQVGSRRRPAISPSMEEEKSGMADAAVTSDPNIVLAILTADCLPVLFCAADGSEIGAAHAGWRGLVAGVLENTVAAMHTPPKKVVAWFGPAAGPNAYEIGAEVRDTFLAHDVRAASAFAPTRPGHWQVDLYALARQRLIDVGVTQVFGGDRCTISEPQHFYSHRRDGRSGRMASSIWMASQ